MLKNQYKYQHINDINFQELNEILELEKNSFLNSEYDILQYNDLINFIKEKYYKIIVVKHQNKVIAYLIFSFNETENEIYKINVNKKYRSQNIATNLINIIKDKNIFLEVSINNVAAINFFEKNGFEKYYIRKNYYKNNIDAILYKFSKK